MTYRVSNCVSKLVHAQDNMHTKLSYYPESKVRMAALPVSVLDVALETLKPPIRAITAAVLSVFTLLGVIFSYGKDNSITNVIRCLENSLKNVAGTPIAIALAPIKLIHKFCMMLFCPSSFGALHSIHRLY